MLISLLDLFKFGEKFSLLTHKNVQNEYEVIVKLKATSFKIYNQIIIKIGLETLNF